MEMPKRLSITIQDRFLPNETDTPYEARWSMYFQGKSYGGYINIRKLDEEVIRAALDAMYSEAIMCLAKLNEPLLGTNE